MSSTTFESAIKAIADLRGTSPSRPVPRVWRAGLVAAVAWLAAGTLTILWADADELDYTRQFAETIVAFGVALAAFALFSPRAPSFFARVRSSGPWLTALGTGLAAWEILTAKTAFERDGVGIWFRSILLVRWFLCCFKQR